MEERFVETARGAKVRVLEAGQGAPVVFLHGPTGLLAENPFLDLLAEGSHVFAPELPGYGESTGETLLEDMLDFTLHGLDVLDALGLDRPHLVGHSMGGMIAAEMACVSPRAVGKLVLAAPLGLWLDAHPVPDLFALLPHQVAQLLFHDPGAGARLLTGGLDFRNLDALKEFYIGNVRRLGMAGKILFPIPNRRLSKRLYRLRAETLLVWGRSDRFVSEPYAGRWQELIPTARLEHVAAAGHMLPYEQPEAFAAAIARFVG